LGIDRANARARLKNELDYEGGIFLRESSKRTS
jgi:hypothetical protein